MSGKKKYIKLNIPEFITNGSDDFIDKHRFQELFVNELQFSCAMCVKHNSIKYNRHRLSKITCFYSTCSCNNKEYYIEL